MSIPDPALELADDVVEEQIPGLNEPRDPESALVDNCRYGASKSILMLRIMNGKRSGGGDDVNQIFNGLTPLLGAIWREDIDLMTMLIKHGADINLCTPVVPSPIWFAVMHRKAAAAAYLLALNPILTGPPSVFYLAPFKDIYDFAEKIGCNFLSPPSPPSIAPSISSSPSLVQNTLVHSFGLPGFGEASYKGIITEFVVDGLLFCVRLIRNSTPREIKRRYAIHNDDSGIFIGLSNKDGTVLPTRYVIRFVARIDVRTNQWHTGSCLSGEIKEDKDDWGVWSYERASNWPFKLMGTYVLEARVTFSLLFSDVQYK